VKERHQKIDRGNGKRTRESKCVKEKEGEREKKRKKGSV